ncbi:MAG: ABC transporter substrate-binding protein [Myxococcales bacterium]|nr:ABC transporter substrate-binding protein [Myxococcales bacterium]
MDQTRIFSKRNSLAETGGSGLFWFLLGLLGCHTSPLVAAPAKEAVTVLLPTEIQEIDPRFVGDAYSLKVSRLLFTSLIQIDPFSLEALPELAEEVTTLDARRYRVRLRTGLRFSDGSPLDANDVMATFESAMDPELASRYRETYGRIQSMTAPDLQTVVFTLRESHATFLTDLELPILPRRYRHSRVIERRGHVVGSGAYRLCGQHSRTLTLCANPYWHRGRAQVARVRLMIVRDDNTRAMRLLAGAADLALNTIPPLLIPLFERDARFDVVSQKGVATTYIGVRTDSDSLRDRRVREAIAYAIDRQALIDAKFGGRATLADGFIPEGHWAYDATLPSYPYRPERARALIAEARRNGVNVGRIRLRTSADRMRLGIGRAVAAMLHQVGIEVDVWPSETATLLEDLRHGRFELAILALPEVFEPHVLSWFFASAHIPTETQVGANRWRYKNSALDRLFEQGVKQGDITKRRPIYQEVQRLLARDLPAIALWHEDNIAVVRTGQLSRYRVPRDGRLGTLALPAKP